MRMTRVENASMNVQEDKHMHENLAKVSSAYCEVKPRENILNTKKTRHLSQRRNHDLQKRHPLKESTNGGWGSVRIHY